MIYSLNFLSRKIAFYQNKYEKDNINLLKLMDIKIKHILTKYYLKLKILNRIYDLPIYITDTEYFRPIFKMKTHCKIKEVKADDSNAVDFDVPENTEVFSVSDGFIVALKTDSTIGGNNPKFAGMDNYIYIKNPETGLIFCYRHLKKNDNLTLNKFIKKGESIGWTANTGYIITPHLHFVAYSYNPNSFYLLKSLKIKLIKIKK